jgi:hypothetical protein
MNEFVNAFKLGQEAAAKSRAAKESIAALINKLSGDLSGATEGRLEVAIRPFNDRVQTPATALLSVVEALANQNYLKVDYLAARNPLAKNTEFKRLVRWTQSDAGFPCRIVYGKTEVASHDIESLTTAIEAALSSAYVGEKLVSIIASSDVNT